MKKKKIIIPILLCGLVIIFVGFTYFNKDNNSQINVPITETNLKSFEESTLLKEYKENTKDFDELSTNEILAKIDKNEAFFLYFGRGTCPYCREFVPILNKESKEKDITINYLDTENTDTDSNIQSLRDRYDVEFVPTLVYLSNYGNDIKVFNVETETLKTFFESIVNENNN